MGFIIINISYKIKKSIKSNKIYKTIKDNNKKLLTRYSYIFIFIRLKLYEDS